MPYCILIPEDKGRCIVEKVRGPYPSEKQARSWMELNVASVYHESCKVVPFEHVYLQKHF